MRGRASPPKRRGPTPPETLGSSPPVTRSFSSARLNAVGAGRPAPRARPSPLALRRARRPGCRAPGPRRTNHHHGADLHHAPARPQPGAPTATSATPSKNPRSTPSPQTSQTSARPLTHTLLRWFPRKRLVKDFTRRVALTAGQSWRCAYSEAAPNTAGGWCWWCWRWRPGR